MSCGQLALQRAGIKYDNYFASEIDKYAIKVTMANFPNTIQLGDIRNVKGADLPKIDLLIGGSPCQGFSFAGKQLNFEDPRSKLFFEYVRLLKETNPKYFLLENVRMKKDSQDVISRYLGVEPIMIDSALVSAQSRKRLYWTNIPGVTQPQTKDIKLQDILENGWVDRTKAYCVTEWYCRFFGNPGYFRRRYFGKKIAQVKFGSEVDYIKNRDLYKADPQSKEDVGTIQALSVLECERLQTVPEGYTFGIPEKSRYSVLGNGWTVDVIAHIFSFMELPAEMKAAV